MKTSLASNSVNLKSVNYSRADSKARSQNTVETFIGELNSINIRARYFIDICKADKLQYGPTIHAEMTGVLSRLSELVSLPLGEYLVDQIRHALTDDIRTSLREITAFGETQAEKFHAIQLIQWLESNFEDAKRYVDDFPITGLSPAQIKMKKLRRLYSLPLRCGGCFRMFDEYLKRSTIEFEMMSEHCCSPNIAATFGGSGPIDLSADIMLLKALEHNITLRISEIDIDAEAINLAKILHGYKVQMGIFEENSKEFFHANLDDLHFIGTNSPSIIENYPTLKTDIIFLAIMVPPTTRKQLIERLRLHNNEDRIKALIIRGAQGLVRDIFYDDRTDLLGTGNGFLPKVAFIPNHALENGRMELLTNPLEKIITGQNDVLTSSWLVT